MQNTPIDKILLLGTGGMAREALCYIKNKSKNYKIAFYDDFTKKSKILIDGRNYPIINKQEKLKKYLDYKFIASIGHPHAKIILVNKILQQGLSPAETIVAPNVYIGRAKLGLGGIIAPGAVIAVDVEINDYVIVNYNATIGHDVVIEDFVSINPGANISGNVHLEKGVLIGAGAFVKEKLKVVELAVIGAKACVVKNIAEPGTYVGIPAKRV